MSTLQEGFVIGNYRIQRLIKENEYTETYKVVNENDNPYFLKLYILKKTPAKIIDPNLHEVMEIKLLRRMQHPNVVSYIGHGTIDLPMGECQYVVTNYFTGEVLSDKIQRASFMEEEALKVFKGILEGLQYLHGMGICHNDITPSNIMLSESTEGTPEIIDMGHSSESCSGKVPFDTMDLDPRYCANATAAGVFDERCDVFSAIAVLYTLITGKSPWNIDFSSGENFGSKMVKMKRYRKEHPVDVLSLPVSDKVKYVLERGLLNSRGDQYQNVSQVLGDLGDNSGANRPGERSERAQKDADEARGSQSQQTSSENELKVTSRRGNGHGFDDIAGMQELKDLLQQKVIFVIQNKELSEQYRLVPPNGMLLYGPPGCGKSFFAEKFAEQTGFNFILVKASDLASIYVHGSQEKIGELFKQAERDAPTVLCFDEFDAFVPNRSLPGTSHVSGEVNEFLTQLNNCSKRGIFVVGTTNRPDMIDPAVLRTGRLDKIIYVPLPDHDARREMFKIHIKGRPYQEDSIDFDRLSDLTDGYIASDIAFIVNDAAMTAAFTRAEITQELLEKSISQTRPSVSKESLQMYDDLQQKMEGIGRANLLPRIGFKKDL